MGKLGPTGRRPVTMLSFIEAEAGLMHMFVQYYLQTTNFLTKPPSTGEADRPPSKVGVAATDIATGLYAHGAIMAALLSRQQTGKGVWIDCNLFESQVSSMSLIDYAPDLIRNKIRLQA